jgi:hypothetical protein
MTGKSVPCIKIDDIPGELLFVVTTSNFEAGQGRSSAIHSFERFIAIEFLDADR